MNLRPRVRDISAEKILCVGLKVRESHPYAIDAAYYSFFTNNNYTVNGLELIKALFLRGRTDRVGDL